DYSAFLVAQKFTPDAVALLTAEAASDVQEAEAARARRQVAGETGGFRPLPVAVVARAARLGLVSLDAYRARLREEGYSDDDVALDVDLLLLEIQQAKATKAKAAGKPPQPDTSGPTLNQLELAVKAGTATLTD